MRDYTKVMDRINEALSKCTSTANFSDLVSGPSSCVEWSHGSALYRTVPRACVNFDARWCRAALDRDKKFAECMDAVKENKKKKEVIDDVIRGKKPDHNQSETKDEIDVAFKGINSKALNSGENKAVAGYQKKGIETARCTEGVAGTPN